MNQDVTKIVLVTGGFDPMHSGHVTYLRDARSLGHILVVGLNSDDWLTRKKGRPFMSYHERWAVLLGCRYVDSVISFNDSDGSARDAIRKVKEQYPSAEIIFANGGDRTNENIPEMDISDPRVSFVFGVGGINKANSSSWLLEDWKAPKTLRPWGYYRVLHDVPGCKVKELTVEPGKSLRMQRHAYRSEYWLVTEGECKVEKELETFIAHKHVTIQISKGQWHQLSNPFTLPCRLVEVQYGEHCVEDDIEVVENQ
jgi:cytidyltransferase-like protein